MPKPPWHARETVGDTDRTPCSTDVPPRFGADPLGHPEGKRSPRFSGKAKAFGGVTPLARHCCAPPAPGSIPGRHPTQRPGEPDRRAPQQTPPSSVPSLMMERFALRKHTKKEEISALLQKSKGAQPW